MQPICTGETYNVGNSTYQTAGIYVDSLTSITGCDSVITLNLSITPNYQLPISATLCANDFYQVGDSLYNQSGLYIDTLSSLCRL